MIEKQHNLLSKLSLPRPLYFPSISSVKTTLSPLEYVKIMSSLKSLYPFFLVSAYDIAHTFMSESNFIEEYINNATSKGITIMIDSGNYESYWKASSWSPKDFHAVLSKIDCPMIFCYDSQSPPQDINQYKRLILANWAEDVKHSKGSVLIPIVHGTKENIPELCQYIAYETKCPIIAVPERRLGDGLIERSKTVANIRSALNSNGVYVYLHLLGTGNPISIAVYAIMGADSFDGLEWCQTVVDPETAFLFHFSQAELFWDNGGYDSENLPYILKTLAHNIEFYSGWMKQLQDAIRSDTAIDFCATRFPHNIYSKISKALHWKKPS